MKSRFSKIYKSKCKKNNVKGKKNNVKGNNIKNNLHFKIANFFCLYYDNSNEVTVEE